MGCFRVAACVWRISTNSHSVLGCSLSFHGWTRTLLDVQCVYVHDVPSGVFSESSVSLKLREAGDEELRHASLISTCILL